MSLGGAGGGEGVLQRKWEQIVGTVARLGIKARTLSSAIVNVSLTVQQLTSVAVVVLGVYLIAERELTVGALVACTILTSRALAPKRPSYSSPPACSS